MKELSIKTQTTGFASPAETYVDKRLDLNDLIVRDLYSTYYFKYSGPNVFDVKQSFISVIVTEYVPLGIFVKSSVV